MRPRGYVPGDWLAVCFRCGFRRLASTLRKHWQGYYVCPEHWESRHPQEFVRGTPDNPTPPWVQPPPVDIDVGICTWNSQTAMPGRAYGGCMVPGRDNVDPNQP